VRSAGAALRGAVEALPPPAAAAAAAAYVQTALAVRTPSPRALFARLPRAGFRAPAYVTYTLRSRKKERKRERAHPARWKGAAFKPPPMRPIPYRTLARQRYGRLGMCVRKRHRATAGTR
jgi:hypothetical protein